MTDLTRTTGCRMGVQTSVRLRKVGERWRCSELGDIVETLSEFRLQVDNETMDLLRRCGAAVSRR